MGILEDIIGQGKVKPLSEEQAKAIVKAASNPMDRMMLTLVLNTGMALGEMVSIRRNDINFAENSITLVLPKNKTRVLRVAPNVMAELKAYLKNSNLGTEDMLAFPITEDMMIKHIQALQAVCPFSWRMLRHTYTDLAIKNHMPISLIANNAGIPVTSIVQGSPTLNTWDGDVKRLI